MCVTLGTTCRAVHIVGVASATWEAGVVNLRMVGEQSGEQVLNIFSNPLPIKARAWFL